MAVPDLCRPWELHDHRADRAMIPYTDDHTAKLVDDAATSLTLMRAPMWLGDAGPAISVLASLAVVTMHCVPAAAGPRDPVRVSTSDMTGRWERALAVDSGITLPFLLAEDPERLMFHNKGNWPVTRSTSSCAPNTPSTVIEPAANIADRTGPRLRCGTSSYRRCHAPRSSCQGLAP